MKKFSNLQEEVKTVKFGLKPIGMTEKFIKDRGLLDAQYSINDRLEEAKLVLDRVYLDVLSRSMSSIDPKIADGLYDVWLKDQEKFTKSDEFNAAKDMFVGKIKGYIRVLIKSNKENYNFNVNNILKDIDTFCGGDDVLKSELNSINNDFSGRSAYFTEYCTSKNPALFGTETNSSSYRVFNENLVTFFKNVKAFLSIGHDHMEMILKSVDGLEKIMVPDDGLKYILQSDIDAYNKVIAEYASARQELQSKNNELNLPKLEKLAKQILSEAEKKFQPIESDEEVFSFLDENIEDLTSAISKVKELFSGIGPIYDKDKILIAKKVKANKGDFSMISNACMHSWDGIKNLIIENWKAENPKSKKKDESAGKYYKNLTHISLSELEKITNSDEATSYLSGLGERNDSEHQEADLVSRAINAYNVFKEEHEKGLDKRLKNIDNSKNIKVFFDTLIQLKDFVAQIYVGEGIDDTCEFYQKLLSLKCKIDEVVSEWGRIRSYLTKKDYIQKELRVYFGLNANLMGGWTHKENGEFPKRSIMFKGVGDDYYVGILARNSDGKKILNGEIGNGSFRYLDITNYDRKNVERLVNTFCGSEKSDTVDGLIKVLTSKEWAQKYPKLVLWQTDGFSSTGEIYKSLCHQEMRWVACSREAVDTMVENGDLYLFKLSCRDFSEHSKGKPQLYTMYLRALLSDDNPLGKYFIMANGKITFRPRTIVDKTNIDNFAIHKANRPIKNKRNIGGGKETATYPYDIEKNKRFKSDSWFISFPLSVNKGKKITQKEINDLVNGMISNGEIKHVIGIDLGERNLVTVSVVNKDTMEIVEQRSLNIIGNTDYNKLMNEMSENVRNDRNNLRMESSMSNMSEGYVSHAVNEIVQLVRKYNAVIAMENLDSNFKVGRSKIIKNIYTKFENQLLDKLSFMVFKDVDKNDIGGVYNPLTMAIKKTAQKDYEKKLSQNGIVFSVRPQYTSSIDPVTGFANVLDMQDVKTIDSIKKFFYSFDYIRYDKEHDHFVFGADWKKFKLKNSVKVNELNRTEWTLVSSGIRLRAEKAKNSSHRTIVEHDPTEVLKRAIGRSGNNFMECGNIKNIIMNQNSHDILDEFLDAVKLILQIRNSKGEEDYILSPAIDENGNQFDSRECHVQTMPKDGDTNGAYNIARRAVMLIRNGASKKYDTNVHWLNFAQTEGRMQTLDNAESANFDNEFKTSELCYSASQRVG